MCHLGISKCLVNLAKPRCHVELVETSLCVSCLSEKYQPSVGECTHCHIATQRAKRVVHISMRIVPIFNVRQLSCAKKKKVRTFFCFEIL